MILFSKGLGNYGRWGNSLFQISFLHSMANRYGTTYTIPKWKHSNLFVNKFNEVDELPKIDSLIKESHYKYAQDYFDNFAENFKTKNVDVLGYFQNEKYFDRNEIRELLKLNPEIVEHIREKYKHLLSKPTIAIGVRRTDYVTSGQYYVLPALYYILTLQKFDYQNCNIVFITDDINWCWFHFKSLPNTFFPQFESDIEQFIFSTLVTEGYIIANSTFHWWGAYLSNAKHVIQPAHLFAGELLQREGNENFYIERDGWEIFDHEPHRINLKDVTFLIPLHFDHEDRLKNLELTVCLLQKNFDTNFIFGEQGGNKFEHFSKWGKYINFSDDTFHRTKFLNAMTNEATTDIVANWDADVNVSPMQLLRSVELIRTNNSDFVYPYEYLFVRVHKSRHKDIFPHYDLAAFAPIMTGVDTKTRPSVGGAVLFNRIKFLEGGSENENFVSYGPEDVERYERFTKLGYKCTRVKGHLYHLDHYVGINSSKSNPFYEQNEKELTKVRSMTKDQLREYTISWPWYSGYTNDYRLEISPTSEQSAQEVFKALKELEIYHGGSVVDIGGGIGSWGTEIEDYTLVDYNVPTELLLTKNYIDHDLREPLKLPRKYDLAICVEVVEHLPENFANTLIQSLTESSDTILFSAAIPNQGGLNHYNEQWPTYWAMKFITHGFYPFHTDIRQLLYDNKKVDLWYRNNLMIFTKNLYNTKYNLNFVHPEYYYQITQHLKG
jgi:hypothetical protein